MDLQNMKVRELRSLDKEIRAQHKKITGKMIEVSRELMKQTVIPKLKKLVGKCYVFRNSYGRDVPFERWNLYIKILKLDGENLVSEKFQLKPIDQADFFVDTYTHIDSKYKEITPEEYDKQRKLLIKKISDGTYHGK